MVRELCLRFVLFILVFILCKKTGNFLVIFLNIFSTFDKIRMRTYIKNLRHSYSNVFHKYQKFQIYIVNIKGDMHDQKIKVKNTFSDKTIPIT